MCTVSSIGLTVLPSTSTLNLRRHREATRGQHPSEHRHDGLRPLPRLPARHRDGAGHRAHLVGAQPSRGLRPIHRASRVGRRRAVDREVLGSGHAGRARTSSGCRSSARGSSGSARSTSTGTAASTSAEDLRGKRIGSPEWAHSAAVYMRGWLHNEVGVKLDEVEWVPGRRERARPRGEGRAVTCRTGVRLTRVADRSLSDLLAAGDIDCAIIARPPTCFLEGHPDVVRLYPDFEERELAYYQRTGVWPIMHIIAMQRRILDEQPVGRAQPLQRVPGVEAPQRRAAARPGGVTLSAALAARVRAADGRPVRRRPVPVRHRAEPADGRAVVAATRTSRGSRTGWRRRRRSSRPGIMTKVVV